MPASEGNSPPALCEGLGGAYEIAVEKALSELQDATKDYLQNADIGTQTLRSNDEAA